MGVDTKAWRKKKYEHVSLEMVGDHIVIIYRENPPVNASNLPMVASIGEIYRGIRDDNDIRCSIVTGRDTEYKGKHYFCSGADVKWWSASDKGETEEEVTSPPMAFPRPYRQVDAWLEGGKPIIAMVNGAAAGAGADFVIATDLTIASEDARIGWSYIQRGIPPMEGGTWMLPRRIGVNRAMELLITGKIIDAQEAYRLGIFNHVVPHDQLRDATMEYAQWYAKGPPLAIGAARALVYQGQKQDFREHLDAIYWAVSSVFPDRTEAMAAWVEKREPHYEGKGIKI